MTSLVRVPAGYTEFELHWSAQPPSVATVNSKTDASTMYKVTVKNIGKFAGDEVVLAYTKPKAHTLRSSLGADVPIEQKKLFGFQRVTLPVGGSAEVSFELTPGHLAMVDADGHTSLHQGALPLDPVDTWWCCRPTMFSVSRSTRIQ